MAERWAVRVNNIMIYNNEFIYIHIPRTGGTSLTETWGNTDMFSKDIHRGKHASAEHVRRRVGEANWNNAYRFTLIRDPWDITCSWYRHVKAAYPLSGTNTWAEYVNRVGAMSFPQFIDEVLTNMVTEGGFLRTWCPANGIAVYRSVQDAHRMLEDHYGRRPLQWLLRSRKDIPVDESFRERVYQHCWYDLEILNSK